MPRATAPSYSSMPARLAWRALSPNAWPVAVRAKAGLRRGIQIRRHICGSATGHSSHGRRRRPRPYHRGDRACGRAPRAIFDRTRAEASARRTEMGVGGRSGEGPQSWSRRQRKGLITPVLHAAPIRALINSFSGATVRHDPIIFRGQRHGPDPRSGALDAFKAQWMRLRRWESSDKSHKGPKRPLPYYWSYFCPRATIFRAPPGSGRWSFRASSAGAVSQASISSGFVRTTGAHRPSPARTTKS